MNNNSTQAEIRNFVSKFSNFFTVLLTLPAYLLIAGYFVMVTYNNLTTLQVVLKSIVTSLFSFRICHNGFVIQEDFKFLPVAGNSNRLEGFNFYKQPKTSIER